MSCDGVQALNPLCQTQELVTNSFNSIADQFAQAANSATTCRESSGRNVMS